LTEQRHEIICPECGAHGMVAPSRRESADFCAQCDFPLFWTPAAVELDRDQTAAVEALRRLPGTAGRVTVASVPCPTCAEANPVGAETCLRCGGPMVLRAPEPVPVVVAPAPEPEPVPEPSTNWWWWVLGGATLIALIALVVVLAVQ
jgi:uncharacterized paraquat-inducible protein A